MSATPVTANTSGPAKGFLWSSLATTVLIVVQLVMGILVLTKPMSAAAHGGVGYITLLGAIAAAYFAWQLSQRGVSKGLFYHALSMPILMIVQIGLGSMGVKWVHVVLGSLIVLGVIGMVPRAAALAKQG